VAICPLLATHIECKDYKSVAVTVGERERERRLQGVKCWTPPATSSSPISLMIAAVVAYKFAKVTC